MATQLPLYKRIRLDPSASPSPPPIPDADKAKQEDDETRASSVYGDAKRESGHDELYDIDDEEDQDHCVICLYHIRDRTVLPCAHDRLCFDCIFVWCQQSRKCPLCNAPIGPFLIHNFRSKYDYSKYYLHPLRVSSPTSASVPEPLLGVGSRTALRSRGRARGQPSRWGVRRRHGSISRERRDTADELEIAIERRRWVYRHGLYAKHVASNPYTRYRPAPTPAQIAASSDLISRATIFVRRELRVWVNLDVEFLTTFILSLMKSLDLRSESAVKLLAEFLDMDTPYYMGDPGEPSTGRFANAEHFSHELYSYLRSPFRDLAAYDAAVQYDTPQDVPPAPLRDSIDLQRQDVDSSARAAPSPRRRVRTHSPRDHSPRDRSPRSPSPSRSNSHVGHSRRQSPRPGSTHHKSFNYNYDRRASKTGGSNAKGKSRASPASKHESWRYEDRLVNTHPADHPRRADTDCAHRPHDQSDERRVLSVAPEMPHNASRASDVTRRDKTARSDRADSPPSASAPSPWFTTDANRQGPQSVTGDTIREVAPRLGEDEPDQVDYGSKTVAISTPWGISIRGEAKRLGHLRQVTPPESDSNGEREHVEASSIVGDARDTESSVPRKRQRGAASLDVVHAHLGYASLSLRQDTKQETANGVTAGDPAASPPNAINGTGVPSDDTLPPDSATTGTLPQPDALSLSSSARKSARDIMARTRAKLSKLRAELPHGSSVASEISGIPSAGMRAETEVTSGGVSSSSMDLRARLMERLEEEKRRATGQPLTRDDQEEEQTQQQQPTLANRPKGGDAEEPAPADCESSNGHGNSQPDGSCPQTRRAEVKLRAQALMRVRLAAEKREADVDVPVRVEPGFADDAVRVREEALRARLLSRRA